MENLSLEEKLMRFAPFKIWKSSNVISWLPQGPYLGVHCAAWKGHHEATATRRALKWTFGMAMNCMHLYLVHVDDKNSTCPLLAAQWRMERRVQSFPQEVHLIAF